MLRARFEHLTQWSFIFGMPCEANTLAKGKFICRLYLSLIQRIGLNFLCVYREPSDLHVTVVLITFVTMQWSVVFRGAENKINNHITDWGQVWPPIVIYTYLQIHIRYKYQLNSWIRCVSFSICNIRKISFCYQYDDLLLFIWIWLSE